MSENRFQKNARVVILTAVGFAFARVIAPETGGFRVERDRDGLEMLVPAVANPLDLPRSAVVDGVRLSAAGY